MAIKNVGKKLNQVYIICSADDAIDWPLSNVSEYKRTLDEKHLVLLPGKEPTRFLCNFDIDAKTDSTIQDAMISGVSEDGKMKPGIGSYNLAIVRATLKDIKNPPDVPADEQLVMRRNGDGSVADETLNQLARFGIISELAAAFTEHTKGNLVRDKEISKNS